MSFRLQASPFVCRRELIALHTHPMYRLSCPQAVDQAYSAHAPVSSLEATCMMLASPRDAASSDSSCMNKASLVPVAVTQGQLVLGCSAPLEVLLSSRSRPYMLLKLSGRCTADGISILQFGRPCKPAVVQLLSAEIAIRQFEHKVLVHYPLVYANC